MREVSVPAVVTIDEAATLTDPVWDNARAAPADVQFRRRTGAGWQDVTCAGFRDEVAALARGLIAAGVEPGARIGLLSRTRYEWTLIDYALWAAGAVPVPIYDTSSAEQVSWILSDSSAAACVVETGEHSRLLAGMRDQLPALTQVWQIEDGGLDALVAGGGGVDPARVEQRRRAAHGDDVATIIYTSGTTGRPKGCPLTHRGLSADIANAIPTLPQLFRPGAATLLFLPLAHVFARLIQIGAVRARVTVAHSAEMKNLAAEFRDVRPTFVLTVPHVFEKVHDDAERTARGARRGVIFDRAERAAIAYSQALDGPSRPWLTLRLRRALYDRLVYRKLRDALGGRCRNAISGGAPLRTDLAHFFRGAGVSILEGYGLTETSAAATTNAHGAQRIGTVGRPLPGVTIRLAEDDEIVVEGAPVFHGYWNNDEATARAFDADGRFHTGDLGALDDDGFLRITGRKKEIIVTTSGKNVTPSLLEERVRAHPLVGHCLVVGDRRPFVAALITVSPDAWPGWLAEHGRPATATVADLRDDGTLRADIQRAVDEANQAVSHAEAIKAFRILPRDFAEAEGEVTPTRKVKRDVVQRRYAEEIDSIYGSR